jgi:glycosyltransferase involved in cell wall biosynthesis
MSKLTTIKPIKISIVTPCFNRPDYLEVAIRSVVEQEGDFEIEYIVQDGGSDEKTLGILRRWEEDIIKGKIKPRCKGLTFSWKSERDEGMYHAIEKGFSAATGDVMAWINTDDFYLPGAFSTVAQIFSDHQSILWIASLPAQANEYAAITNASTLVRPYYREYIARHCYQYRYRRYGITWIQQDTVFWRKELWDQSKGLNGIKAKYAADFYLWANFAKHADLVLVKSLFSCYRYHGNQITATPELYTNEVIKPSSPPPQGLVMLNVLHRLLSLFPNVIDLDRHPSLVKAICAFFGLNWKLLHGGVLEWSYQEKRWLHRDSF